MKTLISFRLRKELDADLIALNVSEDQLPELCRNGLRLMLGLRTTRSVEVKERPLIVPMEREKPAPNLGKPVVFTPKKI